MVADDHTLSESLCLTLTKILVAYHRQHTVHINRLVTEYRFAAHILDKHVYFLMTPLHWIWCTLTLSPLFSCSDTLLLSFLSLSSCDQTLFRMTPRSRSEGTGGTSLRRWPLLRSLSLSEFPTFESPAAFSSVMLADVLQNAPAREKNSPLCIWWFQGDSSVGAEAGSWGDAGGFNTVQYVPCGVRTSRK